MSNRCLVAPSAVGQFSQFACLINREDDFYMELALAAPIREIINPAFRHLHVWSGG